MGDGVVFEELESGKLMLRYDDSVSHQQNVVEWDPSWLSHSMPRKLTSANRSTAVAMVKDYVKGGDFLGSFVDHAAETQNDMFLKLFFEAVVHSDQSSDMMKLYLDLVKEDENRRNHYNKVAGEMYENDCKHDDKVMGEFDALLFKVMEA